MSILEEVSSRMKAENMLRESERSKSVLLSHLPGLAYRCAYDREWTMQYVSNGCFGLTGYSSASLVNNHDLAYGDLIKPEYRDMIWQEWERVLKDRLPFVFEYEIITAQGEPKWVLELGEGIFTNRGEVEALEGIVIDISKHKNPEDALVFNSNYDKWTGLCNRSFLEKQLDEEIMQGTLEHGALVEFNFGSVDTMSQVHGYNYTQDIMKKIGIKLLNNSTDKRLLCNTFWNRFVFYIKDYRNIDELLEFCRSIACELEVVLKTERMSCGIGILEIQQTSSCADMLLKKLLIASELAMQNNEKRTNISIYNIEMEFRIYREEEIINELSRIADGKTNGGLFLQYQPILDVRSNRICGFEALARVNSDMLGLIPPLEFIPLAEKTKLILPIGRKIILEALRFIIMLDKRGYGDLVININISSIQLLSSNFTEELLLTLREMQVSPKSIGIELTESIFTGEFERINEILNTMRRTGIHVYIDDFGTGYSSLARESEMNVDYLKIDKFFIDKLLEIEPERAITGDIISMAHKMGHGVVAEGVEHEVQKQYLIRNGCDKIQGYLISKPLDEEAAIELLHKQKYSC